MRYNRHPTQQHQLTWVRWINAKAVRLREAQRNEIRTRELLAMIKHERNYRDTVPIKGVTCSHKSNDTSLEKATGKINMNCDNCQGSYETYAAWAKRYNNHFCSNSCKDEFKKIKIRKICVICDKQFVTNPTTWFRHVTCSRACLKLDRVSRFEGDPFYARRH